MFISRRNMLIGIGAGIVAPAIVKIGGLMPIRGIIMQVPKPFVTLGEHLRDLRYYKLNGREVVEAADVFEWGQMLKNIDGRRVGHTTVGMSNVSTMFLGLDHGFSLNPNHPPVVFESMVFDAYNNGGNTRRYSTYDEAERGHKEMVAELRRKEFKVV